MSFVCALLMRIWWWRKSHETTNTTFVLLICADSKFSQPILWTHHKWFTSWRSFLYNFCNNTTILLILHILQICLPWRISVQHCSLVCRKFLLYRTARVVARSARSAWDETRFLLFLLLFSCRRNDLPWNIDHQFIAGLVIRTSTLVASIIIFFFLCGRSLIVKIVGWLGRRWRRKLDQSAANSQQTGPFLKRLLRSSVIVQVSETTTCFLLQRIDGLMDWRRWLLFCHHPLLFENQLEMSLIVFVICCMTWRWFRSA